MNTHLKEYEFHRQFSSEKGATNCSSADLYYKQPQKSCKTAGGQL
jgi:hypothetical protein